MQMNLSKFYAPVYYGLHHDIKDHRHTHYWLKGGRGSGKSTFIALEIIAGMMRNKERNAVVFRKVGDTLRSSVYEQLLWAIEQYGVSDAWKTYAQKLTMVYKPTGQVIQFRGVDNPKKSKSIKTAHGYFAYCWYEELDEFSSMEEIDVINQSILRGGDKFWVFYSFNPPKSKNAWVNYECDRPRGDKVVHASTYLDVPKDWLGPQFMVEAETMRTQNYERYLHEFIGIPIGIGGEVFDNIEEKEITAGDIANFDVVRHGVDFGFAVDPFCYVKVAVDRKRGDIYIFDEIYKQKLTNIDAAQELEVKLADYDKPIVKADSAEPKSIKEFRTFGINMYGVKKWPDSVKYGIKFLQGLHRIYIDRRRAPHAYKEFVSYEYERNKDGEFISAYPDKDNHAIDAVRYALESDMPARSQIKAGRINY